MTCEHPKEYNYYIYIIITREKGKLITTYRLQYIINIISAKDIYYIPIPTDRKHDFRFLIFV